MAPRRAQPAKNRQADFAAPQDESTSRGGRMTMAERHAPRPPACRPSARAFSGAALTAAQGKLFGRFLKVAEAVRRLRHRVPPSPRRRSAALPRDLARRPYCRLRHPPGREPVRRAALAPFRGVAGPGASACAPAAAARQGRCGRPAIRARHARLSARRAAEPRQAGGVQRDGHKGAENHGAARCN